jgi:hypothetical protein
MKKRGLEFGSRKSKQPGPSFSEGAMAESYHGPWDQGRERDYMLKQAPKETGKGPGILFYNVSGELTRLS